MSIFKEPAFAGNEAVEAASYESLEYLSLQRTFLANGDFILKSAREAVPWERGTVESFTLSSIKRMTRYLRNARADYSHFITLTYPQSYSKDGAVVKEHLRQFNQWLLRFLDGQATGGMEPSIFWFLEFQKRGAPHFHLFVTGFVPKQLLAKRWYELVKSGDERHLRAGTNIQAMRRGRSGTVAYAKKYAAKSNQKSCPGEYANVGRFWGISGCRATVEAATSFFKELYVNVEFKASYAAFWDVIEREMLDGNVEEQAMESGGTLYLFKDEEVWKRIYAAFMIFCTRCYQKWGIRNQRVYLFRGAELVPEMTESEEDYAYCV